MKFTKAACFATIAMLALSTAGQAVAAGSSLDPWGRQGGSVIDPIGRQGGSVIDPIGRQGGSIIDPVGRDSGAGYDPNGRSWLSDLLRRWFGWS